MKLYQLVATTESLVRIDKQVYATRKEAAGHIPAFLDACQKSGMVAHSVATIKLTFNDEQLRTLLQPQFLQDVADEMDDHHLYTANLLY